MPLPDTLHVAQVVRETFVGVNDEVKEGVTLGFTVVLRYVRVSSYNFGYLVVD